MKRILITSNNSYIGHSFAEWVSRWPGMYLTETISVRGDKWQDIPFKGYDVILHCAALVHNYSRSLSDFYSVNRDLTYEIAKKAKAEGVKHFIFLSTIGVYGAGNDFITQNTKPAPQTPYAKSKYEAEGLLETLNGSEFIVAIVRSPMVYGKRCKGNYAKFSKVVKMLKTFPSYRNERSMIFIDNLTEFLRIIVDNKHSGTFAPQNDKYVSTYELARLIREAHGMPTHITNIFNIMIVVGIRINRTIRKAFGSCKYSYEMLGSPNSTLNETNFKYTTCTLEESIDKTEKQVEI